MGCRVIVGLRGGDLSVLLGGFGKLPDLEKPIGGIGLRCLRRRLS
jgi:hypothetical protein